MKSCLARLLAVGTTLSFQTKCYPHCAHDIPQRKFCRFSVTTKHLSQSRTSNDLFGLQKFKTASASHSLSSPVQLSQRLPFSKSGSLKYHPFTYIKVNWLTYIDPWLLVTMRSSAYRGNLCYLAQARHIVLHLNCISFY